MVVRKIDLEEKRVHAPNPMSHEPFFLLLVVSASTTPKVVVQAPAETPPMTTMSEDSKPVRQEPIEPTVEQEREQQQPPPEDMPHVETHDEPVHEAPRRSQRVKKQQFLKIIKFITQKEFK